LLLLLQRLCLIGARAKGQLRLVLIGYLVLLEIGIRIQIGIDLGLAGRLLLLELICRIHLRVALLLVQLLVLLLVLLLVVHLIDGADHLGMAGLGLAHHSGEIRLRGDGQLLRVHRRRHGAFRIRFLLRHATLLLLLLLHVEILLLSLGLRGIGIRTTAARG